MADTVFAYKTGLLNPTIRVAAVDSLVFLDEEMHQQTAAEK